MLLTNRPMPGPDIDEIATFIRVVRQGSLAGAARELELPKSTVSRRVSRLEERLHVELLYRMGRKVLITPEGKRLYDRVATSVDTIELAMRGTLSDAELPRGNIRLTAPPDFGRLILLDALVSFAEAFPEITVDLELTDRFADVAAEGFDLAVRAGQPPTTTASDSLITRPLLATSQVLAASPELAERVSCFGDLATVPFVLFRTPSTRHPLRVENEAGRVYEMCVEGRFVVHDFTSMAELVARGVGVGLMPSLHIDRAPQRGSLVRILPGLSASATDIALVYPSRRLPVRVRLLIDYLERCVTTNST
ncbi:MAG: DNA-binding transcriptional LysR family regulator [Polyangiales bacterium]|jgi:DNA-binding transcriptional LysR family regulator